MKDLTALLDPIAGTHERMIDTVIDLARQNSGSFNLPGLDTMLDKAMALFEPLCEKSERIGLPPLQSMSDRGTLEATGLGDAGRLIARPGAPVQLLFVGHYDTVFGPEHPFQDVRYSQPGVLNGPGVADMKGGLVVLQSALAAFEASPWASHVGWEIILNPDEELGSVGSASLLASAAQGKHAGFIFEPTFPNGNLASERKGSGTFHIVARGRAAHAGRDHHLGRNAIEGLAEAIRIAQGLNGQWPDTTVNVGYVHGGGPTNIVPDVAVAKLNVRVPDATTGDAIVQALQSMVSEVDVPDVEFEVGGEFTRPPKPLTAPTLQLLEFVAATASDLDIHVGWEPTGGVSDGNNLSAAGLTNVDNIGVRGGNIHSEQEFLVTESLTERARLAAALLMHIGAGEFDPRELG